MSAPQKAAGSPAMASVLLAGVGLASLLWDTACAVQLVATDPGPDPATVEHVGVTPDDLVYSSWWWDDALEFANDLAAATGVRHSVTSVIGIGWVVMPR